MADDFRAKALQSHLAEKAYGSILSSQYAEATKSAAANEAARRLNIAPDLIEADFPNMMAEDRLRRAAAEAQRNAAYAKIMANRRLAAVAIDDAAMPKLATQVDAHAQSVKQRSLGSSILAYPGELGESLKSRTATLEAGFHRSMSSITGGWASDRYRSAARQGEAYAATHGSGDSLTTWEEVKANPLYAPKFGVEQILTSAPDMLSTLNPATFGAYIFARSGEIGQQRAVADGRGDATFKDIAIASPFAAASAALERIGVHGIGTGIAGGTARAILAAGKKEAITEYFQSGIEYLGGQAGTKQGADANTMFDQMEGGAVGGFFGGGAVAGAGAQIKRVTDKMSQRQDDLNAAHSVDQIMATSEASTTRASNPSDFREALNQLVGETAAEHIYVPAEAVQSLFQDASITDDPFWSAYAEQVDEAAALGGDVVIPLADAATSMDRGQWQQIREAVRVSPKGASIAEARERQSPEELERMATTVAGALEQGVGKVQIAQAQRIVSDFGQRLGRTGVEAKTLNRLLSRAMVTAYNRDASRRAGLGVAVQPMADWAAKWLPSATTEAQAAYEAPVAKPVKAAKPKKALDVIAFIRKRGGILDTEGHDLSKGRGLKRHPGLINNKRGMSIDAIGEALHEAGYFNRGQDRPTTDDVLQLIEKANTTKTYALDETVDALEAAQAEMPVQHDEAWEAETRAEIMKAAEATGMNLMEPEINAAMAYMAMGVDVNQAIADGFADVEASLFNQGETAFEKWFAGSKVVDDHGAPLVVYHGTAENFDTFNGNNFFSDKRAVAERFRDGVSATYDDGRKGRVVSAYLRIERPVIIDAEGDFAANVQFGKAREAWEAALADPDADGIFIRNTKDEGNIYIPRDPTQIKSTANRGSFDPSDPRILYQSADRQAALAAWFAGSEMVNPDGSPMVFYHGTESDFEAFDPEQTGKQSDKGWFGKALYFTPDAEQASRYATVIRTSPGFGDDAPKGSVMPVYIKAENPFYTDHQSFNQDYVDRLRAEGYDAIVRVERMGDEIPQEVVVFEPGQVKSTLNTGAFNANDPRILYQAEEAAFYSAAERVVEQSRQERASAEQWKALLTPGKTPGIKAEEIEWSGIHDWLDMQTGPVEKSALLDVLRERGIKIEEVVLGGSGAFTQSDIEKEADRRYEELVSEALDAAENRGFDIDDDYVQEVRNSLSYGDVRDEVESEYNEEFGNDTQFKSWSSDPSNDSYRELLITLPIGSGGNPDRAPSTHWDTEAVVAHARFMDKTDADGKRVLFIEEVQSDWHQKGRDEGYSTPLPPEEVAAAEDAFVAAVQEVSRASDALAETMAEQRPALFHQRSDGSWMVNASLSSIEREAAMVSEEALERATAYKLAELRANEANQVRQNASKPGIPEAPFKSSWPALVMKRMIVHAAREGYDRVAWTTGEEQSTRYNLSAAVGERLHISSQNDGRYNVSADNRSATDTLISNDMGERGNSGIQMTAEQLATAFGKDVAERLIAAAPPVGEGLGYIEGAGLNVGGEGMRAFYDRNLVNITNDIIKKYGTKVGPVNFGTKSVDDEWWNMVVERYPTDSAEYQTAANTKAKAEAAVHINPGFDITPKMREAATGGFTLFQTKRGNIEIIPGPDGFMETALIRAFEAANASTAIHELGHFFAEDLRRRANTEGATDQEKADDATLREWLATLGVEYGEGQPIPEEGHEYIARGFERYFWEGKAPSQALRDIFFKMREFMLTVYRRASQFNAPITPEVREVFDRILAADAEIAEARREMGLNSATVSELMSDDERKAYSDIAAERDKDAKDQLLARIVGVLRREKVDAEVRERKAEITSEAEEAIDQQPVFQAMRILRVGVPNGDGFDKVRLSRQWLNDTYGEGADLRVPKGGPPIVSDRDTMDADDIASLAGFASGDALVNALFGLEAERLTMQEGGDKRSVRRRLIEEAVDARVRDEIGDPFAELEEEAESILASERQADLMSFELRILARKVGRKPTPWKLATEWAKGHVEALATKDVATGRMLQLYTRNASKAAEAVEQALTKGAFDEAFDAKQRQLLNLALLSEAKKAKDAVDTAVRRMGKIAAKATIKSVEQDSLEQAHQLLEDVVLKQVPQSRVNARKAFETWYAEQVAQGREPIVPPEYQRMLGKRDWKELPIGELLELDAVVKQIIALGRIKQKLRDGQEQRDFDAGIEALVEGAIASTAERTITTDNNPEVSLLGRAKSRIRSGDAAMIKVQQLVNWLDNGDPTGPWHTLLYRQATEAQGRENDLMRGYAEAMNGMITALPKALRKGLTRKVDTPELINNVRGDPNQGKPWSFTMDQIVMMAMNYGNAGNRQRLLDGFGWNEQQAEAVFDRLMTKQHWDFVEQTWRLVDTLWPDLSQMERRVNGVAPDKVEGIEVHTPHGTYQGGYFPAVYDSNYSTRAELNEISKLSPNGAWHQVSVSSSASKARVQRVMGRPLLLSMGVITNHMSEVVHDITHREAVAQMRKIMSDGRIRSVIAARMGKEYRSAIDNWIENIATPNVAYSKSDRGLVQLGRYLNKGISITGMGLRVSTILVQPVGLSNLSAEIGSDWVAKGSKIFASQGIKAYNDVIARSAEMRGRFDTLDVSLDDMMAAANAGGLHKIGQGMNAKSAFFGILYMDLYITTAGWIGAYNKAMTEGIGGSGPMSEEDASFYADTVITSTQGAGGNKDRSGIMREHPLIRMFYPFFSYGNAFFNQQRNIGHLVRKAETGADYVEAARRFWWVGVVATLVPALLFGEGPPEDEQTAEGWLMYCLKAMMLGNTAGVPFFGPLVNSVAMSYGYSSTALQRVGDDIGKVIESVDDDELKGVTIKRLMTLVGIGTHLPLGQPGATAGGLYDYSQGDAEPEDFGDWFELLSKGKVSKSPTAAEQMMGEGAIQDGAE